MTQDKSVYVYVFLSIAAITILVVFLSRKDKHHAKKINVKDINQRTEKYTSDQLATLRNVQNLQGMETSEHPKDHCLCSGIFDRTKNCINREEREYSYTQGNNEFQDFAGEQEKIGGPAWKNTDRSVY